MDRSAAAGADPASPLEAPPVRLSRFGSTYVLALLTLINIVNYADRTLISVLAPAIQRDLRLSDTRVGLITGLAFALTYGVFGLVLARLADRYGHGRILVAAVALWSVMCLATAQVRSFAQLFVVRLGLGIGEAGAAPASYALIHAGFDAKRRPIAYAVFAGGTTVGIGTGVAAGGLLGSAFGWRLTMSFMVIPGLLLAATFALSVREPRHRRTVEMCPGSPLAAMRDIAADPLRRSLIGAYALSSFAYAGFAQWAPTFYMRNLGMSLKEVGTEYSISSSGSALVGILLGGFTVGPMLARNPARALRLCVWLSLAAAMASAAAFLSTTPFVSLALFALFGICAGATYSPTIALFQDRSPAGTHAFAGAVMLLVAIVFGQGLGPLFIGMASDALRGQIPQSLGLALAMTSASLVIAAIFLSNAVCVTSRGGPGLSTI